jgi:hypothetical protein
VRYIGDRFYPRYKDLTETFASIHGSTANNQLAEVLVMLRDIHTLIRQEPRNNFVQMPMTLTLAQTTQNPQLLTFRLYVRSARQDRLICDRALLHPEWSANVHGRSAQLPHVVESYPFTCGCRSGADLAAAPHKVRLEGFSSKEDI